MKKLVSFIAVLLFSLSSFASICMNDVVPAFPESDRSSIESLIIDGAEKFLSSHAYAFQVLREYEKSSKQGLNYDITLLYIDTAISELRASLEKYLEAFETGKRAGYKEDVIIKFKQFAYETYIENNKLNSEVATMVKNYMSKGDILGLYQHNLNRIQEILSTLNEIRDQLQNNDTKIASYWKLLQQYSNTALFGNYATLTAKQILE